MPHRFRLIEAGRADPLSELKADVLAGFAEPGRRSLPPTYFYDDAGAALYEQITRLPEYYQTRTEAALLAEIGPELAARLGPAPLVELGSGSSEKTRVLLDAWRAPVRYVPIDVHPGSLISAGEALVRDYPALEVEAIAGRYHAALDALPPLDRPLVLFLGGTVGNFDDREQAAFFDHVAARVSPGAHLLLGFDRTPHAHKPVEVIEAAYDDAAGVTARFNLNLLARLNRELSATFDLSAWAHEAIWVPELERIEMRLVSLLDQEVGVPAIERGYRFARGERILTELSRRYDPDALSAWLARRHWSPVALWQDPALRYCLLLIARP